MVTGEGDRTRNPKALSSGSVISEKDQFKRVQDLVALGTQHEGEKWEILREGNVHTMRVRLVAEGYCACAECEAAFAEAVELLRGMGR